MDPELPPTRLVALAHCAVNSNLLISFPLKSLAVIKRKTYLFLTRMKKINARSTKCGISCVNITLVV